MVGRKAKCMLTNQTALMHRPSKYQSTVPQVLIAVWVMLSTGSTTACVITFW